MLFARYRSSKLLYAFLVTVLLFVYDYFITVVVYSLADEALNNEFSSETFTFPIESHRARVGYELGNMYRNISTTECDLYN